MENSLIPSPVPNELKDLTQIEEMLIARALPIMRVYIKPGGQRGYSGHCINLPQNVTELATFLPRYPKDLAVIIVKVKGRDNTFRDVTVRKQKVHNALVWLINNNPHYSEITINEDALGLLPENGVVPDLMTVETDNDIVSDDNCSADVVQLITVYQHGKCFIFSITKLAISGDMCLTLEWWEIFCIDKVISTQLLTNQHSEFTNAVLV